ncbi:MAG: hypothetical protein U9R08_02785 [Nanoarchaeota archaeon]|nr:hypothetical protein [Nanoarchaeota archaeon]
MDISIPQDNRNIKKALIKAFPNYKISVRTGGGTAYGWKLIDIITDIKERLDSEGFLKYNKEEKKQFNEIEKIANKIIHETGKKISHYIADDGYNTEESEVLLNIRGTL